MKLSTNAYTLIFLTFFLFSCSSEEKGNKEGNAADSTVARKDAPPIKSIKKYKITANDMNGVLIEDEAYNEAGKLIKDIDYIPGTETIWQTRTFEYDEEGRHTMETSVDQEGNNLMTTYKYGDDGHLSTEEISENEEFYFYEYSHDGKGNVVKTIKKDENGNVLSSSETKYEYTAEGRIVSRESWMTDKKGKEKSRMKLVFIYDSKGNMVKEEEYDGKGKLVETVEMKYDENNREIETIEYRNGKFSLKMMSTYNEMGDLIKEETCEKSPDEITYTETYEFDEYGNETKTWYEQGGKDSYGERIEIVYRK